MNRSAPSDPPYLRIAAELRRRITAGELRPGDRVPSTRQLTQDWGVALATATKALAVLNQEGLVRAVSRVGTVVATPDPAPVPRRRAAEESDGELTRERLASAAIGIADTEGLESLSMRRVASRLGVPTMSLYRHIRGRDDLVLLMTDTAFGEDAYPDDSPPGWRAQLETLARLQWALYRRHPWLAKVVTLTRPLPLPNLMTQAEWALRAVDGLGLEPAAMFYVHITMYSYVQGLAVNLVTEAETEAETGVTVDEWGQAQNTSYAAILGSGSFPAFSRVYQEFANGFDLDLDQAFEFGLQPMLDGLATVIEPG